MLRSMNPLRASLLLIGIAGSAFAAVYAAFAGDIASIVDTRRIDEATGSMVTP